MSLFPRPACSLASRVGLLAAVVVLLTACNGGSNRNAPSNLGGGQLAPLVISCSLSSDTVLAGGSPVLVYARVSRGGLPVSGAPVAFGATRGSLDSAQVSTDGDGLAVVRYTPPSSPGSTRVDATVTDPRYGDSATSSCTFDVIQARNPRLAVQLLLPTQAAGLEVRVTYSPSRVDLPAGAVTAVGPMAGAACLPVANDNDAGLAQLNIACSALQGPLGTVAHFDFVHLSGPELTAQDFTVTCQAFDEFGRPVGTSCTATVSQR